MDLLKSRRLRGRSSDFYTVFMPFIALKRVPRKVKCSRVILSSCSRFEPISKAGKVPVTTVAFAEDLLRGDNLDYGILAIGTESGRIEVWAVPLPSNDNSAETDAKSRLPTLMTEIPANESHFDTVKQLSWRPSRNEVDEEGLMHLTLASCGQDNGVRIFEVSARRE